MDIEMNVAEAVKLVKARDSAEERTWEVNHLLLDVDQDNPDSDRLLWNVLFIQELGVQGVWPTHVVG